MFTPLTKEQESKVNGGSIVIDPRSLAYTGNIYTPPVKKTGV